MKKHGFFIIFIFLPFLLYSQQVKFEWDFKMNQTFTIDKYTTQTVIKDGKITYEKIIKDYVVLLPQREEKNGFIHLPGKYYSYSKDLRKESMYQLESAYDLDFQMNRRGEYIVPENMVMPSIRNIPLFPENAVSPGYLWTGKGVEILEFTPTITLPVEVSYQFIGFEEKFSKKLAKIVFSYLWNHIVDHNYTDVPYKFIGSSYSALWYDTESRLPVYIENLYDLGMMYRNGMMIEYKGDLKGYYNLKRTEEEKTGVKNDMYNKLKKADEKMDVRKDKNNLIINLGEIYFKFDSAELTKEAQEKLKKIGDVLNNYKDCRVLTKGHTDNSGNKQYNQKLSEARAKSVLELLINEQSIDKDQASYQGAGEKEPRYDNRNKEGREKNRRVEIIITPE